MAKKRLENLAVFIGRNRRVYSRIYKMIDRIPDFAEHYLQKERVDCRSKCEGGSPMGYKLEKPTETIWVFRAYYEPCET